MSEKWTIQQKVGAALLGLGALAGVGVAIASAVSGDKDKGSGFFGSNKFGAGEPFKRRRLGRASCKPCDKEG